MLNSRFGCYDGSSSEYIYLLEAIVRAQKDHHSRLHATCECPLTTEQQTFLASLEPEAIATPTTETNPERTPAITARDELQIFLEDPSTRRPFKRKKANPGGSLRKLERITWREKADDLLQRIPRVRTWRHVLDRHGIYQYLRGGTFLAELLDGTGLKNPASIAEPIPSQAEANASVERLTKFAKAAARLESSARIARGLAVFQQFITLSSCAVLLADNTIPRDTIFKIAKICINSTCEVSDDYCRQLLQTICFVNSLIDGLSAGRLGKHASELLLIWKSPVASFFHLGRSKQTRTKSLEYLQTGLNSILVSNVEEDWTEVFIPSIVHHVLNKAVSVQTIGRILGYKNTEVLGDRINPWRFFNTGARADRAASSVGEVLASTLEIGRDTIRHSFESSHGEFGSVLDTEGMLQFAEGAQPYKIYESHPKEPFAYEMLERENWNQKVERIASLMVGAKVEDTVQRRRDPQRSTNDLLRAWCIFRLKPAEGDGWKPVLGGFATEQNVSQAVIFVALEDLSPQNGFFMTLQKGHWVCKEGAEIVMQPSTGGGIGLFFALCI